MQALLRPLRHLLLCLQFGKLVADNVLAFDQKFWVRLAARSDMAPAQDKERCGWCCSNIPVSPAAGPLHGKPEPA